jgi:protein TonB
MQRRLAVFLVLSALGAVPVGAQEPRLATARDLYASARYDEALAILDAVKPGDGASTIERRAVAQYRSLCLLALGRGDEAEAAIAAVIAADPTYQPSETDASPRVRNAFSDVRRRMLPDIATRRYQEAKALYDSKHWEEATAGFRDVLGLLDDPDMGGRLADLRVLVTGFIDLSVAAATPPPPPPPAPEPAPAGIISGPASAEPAPAGAALAVPSTAAAPAPPARPAIASADDPGVIPPVTVAQDVPKVPASILQHCQERGLLEVTIDEQGRVVGVSVRASIHPLYDSMLLEAARGWRYRPATLDGEPIAFRKVIQIAVSR